MQARPTCLPTSGKGNAEWLTVAPSQFVVEWQSEQSCGNPAAECFGLVVAWYVARWQDAQVVASPLYTPEEWHCTQVACKCVPVNGNVVIVVWLNVAPVHCVVV